ncbi:hypothetical protein I3843_11G037400 [Carya illinoinensis]|uniref:Uncharacterized protein n=1 Tax=Carya illinoinensis TaxID=32201 RepID=A0A8T1P391_CARIL|nr:hypothetical protein CIPAW_11G037500 [Carya illinoinensis]KAG7954783.1 hypothetical protein I3843_11G037400 [Carya illinoinensis]
MVVISDIQDQLGQQVTSSIGIDKCSHVHCDVSDEDQVKKTVESTVQKYGRLDIMFSNAGIVSASEQTVLELEFSQFDRLFAINARGMALCMTTPSQGRKWRTDYGMTKHAVLGLVRSASVQLGVHGIRVNFASPYVVATPMVFKALGISNAGKEEEVEKIFEPYAVLNGVLKAKNIADAVLSLASDDSERVTGHNLVVDGGYIPS